MKPLNTTCKLKGMTVSLLFLLFFLFAQNVFAQDNSAFNQKRKNINQAGMIILGSWAVGNIVLNPILARNAQGSDKYFHQMNVMWNMVNLAIAGFGFYSAFKESPELFSALQTIEEHRKIKKILLINAGLDVGYMLGGLYMMHRSKTATNRPERLKGFGQAVVLQGAFLFVFDLILYSVHAAHGNSMPQIFEQVSISPMGINFHFRL